MSRVSELNESNKSEVSGAFISLAYYQRRQSDGGGSVGSEYMKAVDALEPFGLKKDTNVPMDSSVIEWYLRGSYEELTSIMNDTFGTTDVAKDLGQGDRLDIVIVG